MHPLIEILITLLKIMVVLAGAIALVDLTVKKQKGFDMKIQKFADEVTKDEGKIVSVNKGQVLEIMKIINRRTNGALYREIRSLPEKSQ